MKIDRDTNKKIVKITPETPIEANQVEHAPISDLCDEYHVQVGETLEIAETKWNTMHKFKRESSSSFSLI